jgi:hypothetical protein
MKLRTSLIVLGLALAACQTAPKGDKLSAAQVTQALVGNTAVGRTAAGDDFAVYDGANGTAKIQMVKYNDVGTYRITEDGMWCVKWKAFAGQESCAVIYRNGDTYQSVLPDGSLVSTYTIVPGNPRNL